MLAKDPREPEEAQSWFNLANANYGMGFLKIIRKTNSHKGQDRV